MVEQSIEPLAELLVLRFVDFGEAGSLDFEYNPRRAGDKLSAKGRLDDGETL